MAEIISKAETQYIDDNGKTRYLNYNVKGKGLTLMTPPLAPLDLPLDSKIYNCSAELALGFIERNGLEITFQDVKEDQAKGLWLEKDYYIPIKKRDPLENIKFAEETLTDPIRVEAKKGQSLLDEFRTNRKIAEFLKQYTLYTYSLNPEKFGKKSFTILQDHKYEIEKLKNQFFVEDNDVIYRDNKIIVTSATTRDKLLNYLKSSILNDMPGILKIKGTTTIEENYRTISDFKEFPNQLIFSSENGIKRWKREIVRVEEFGSVSGAPLPHTTEPYFYRMSNIRNNPLVIIQNVDKGELALSILISYKWAKDKVNKGYFHFDSSALPKEISYSVYTNEGKIKTKKGKTEDYATVMLYENGKYGAILFLED